MTRPCGKRPESLDGQHVGNAHPMAGFGLGSLNQRSNHQANSGVEKVAAMSSASMSGQILMWIGHYMGLQGLFRLDLVLSPVISDPEREQRSRKGGKCNRFEDKNSVLRGIIGLRTPPRKRFIHSPELREIGDAEKVCARGSSEDSGVAQGGYTQSLKINSPPEAKRHEKKEEFKQSDRKADFGLGGATGNGMGFFVGSNWERSAERGRRRRGLETGRQTDRNFEEGAWT
ncbi:hypothetical protein B0H14DRAFT_3174076 [Mycena olivaceomarginata]|nr:hypothetical protein B0H14DRAFT_3174076 [Mycena olivaceomarginata]